jgi:hypothetical protein
MPNWGIDDEIDTTATDASPPTRELVPEGDHEFTVKAVIDTAERVEIRLAHDDRRYGWVFAKMPKAANWARKILSSLRTALGITREAWAGLPITDLEGLRVKARVYHRAGDRGTWVNVAEFLPCEAAIETATAKPATGRAPPAVATKHRHLMRSDLHPAGVRRKPHDTGPTHRDVA